MDKSAPDVITLLVAAQKSGRWDWPVLALELLEEYGWKIVHEPTPLRVVRKETRTR